MNYFYLSGTMMNNGQTFNCGDKIINFDEQKF